MRWGAGAGASRLISGTMSLHRQLEERLAEFKGTEAALLFGSGYLANTGVIAGARRRGRGRLLRRAQPRQHHRRLPARAGGDLRLPPPRHSSTSSGACARPASGRALIVTDGVFSMDGDVAPLRRARRARAPPRLPADGRRGARHRVRSGPAAAARSPRPGSSGEVDVVVGTLGKALGSYGAYVCALARADRAAGQHRAPVHLLDRAAAARRSAAALAALELLRAAPGRGRAAAPRTPRRCARRCAPQGLDAGRLADPDRAARGRRRATARWRSASARSSAASSPRRSARRPCPQGRSRLRLTVMATHRADELRAAAARDRRGGARARRRAARAERSRTPRRRRAAARR